MTIRVILGAVVGGSRRSNLQPEELGAVTAEFAVALPAVTTVLALCLGAASTGVAQVKLEESARAAARAAARGDSEAEIRAVVKRIDPAQSVQVNATNGESGEGPQVQVVVSRPAPGVIGSTTGWTLRAEAHARQEGGIDETEELGGHRADSGGPG